MEKVKEKKKATLENEQLEDVSEELLTEKVELTKEEVEAINKKAQEAEERFLRAQADLVNYRKRKDEEVLRQLKYANEDLVLELLPILDNFERAIKMGKSGNDANFINGINMVYTSLTKALEKYGVTEIEALDKPFDPVYHQAVMTECDDSKQKEIILEVYQKGYILKDKVIRPAMVKVNK